jgi:hypothetical protein
MVISALITVCTARQGVARNNLFAWNKNLNWFTDRLRLAELSFGEDKDNLRKSARHFVAIHGHKTRDEVLNA